MRKIERFGIFVFHSDAEGIPLKCADSPEECATFRNIPDAFKEVEERHIDYGVRTEIVDLDSNTVVLETTDEGRIWNAPVRARKPAVPVPA